MQENDHQKPKQLKGFYGKAKISVNVLDKLIVVGVIALVAVLAFGMQHRGFTITFDSTGGTVVEPQTKMFGEYVDIPEDPTREGYTFEYWSLDRDGEAKWNMKEDKVSESMTLYANWK